MERYIQPVSVSQIPPEDVPRTPVEPSAILVMLALRGYQPIITSTIQGGYMSQVFAAQDPEGGNVVIKHTEDTIPTDPTAFFISKNSINTDAEVLSRLSGSPISSFQVPHLLHHYPEITTTVMNDLRDDGMGLLVGMILGGTLPIDSAQHVGVALADLEKATRSWEPFDTTCSARENIYDRGLELRLAYPNDQRHYLEIEDEFLNQQQGWTWVDGTPKNLMLNPQTADVAFIDFGLSCFADTRHGLPNFLSHIAVYGVAEIIDPRKAAEFITICAAGYADNTTLDEEIFCKYFGMEVLHRAMGKRIPGVATRGQKTSLVNYGLSIFDDHISTVEGLTSLLCAET